MAVLKCKMCGGNLDVEEGMTVCECEYCGSKQTVPSVDNEKKINLFSRANRLRANCEFDKAFGVYESIIADFQEEAEAYWGLLLCKYGIEYVDDPATGRKIPTCHRSSFNSIMEDPDFEMVMENSDETSRAIYREEAKAIEALRISINEVSSKEAPYDIFICYKETDSIGERTVDSVIAQDVYTALTEKGYKVFFSRITLEDKLGQEYEPYIFAALNSAKIMLVFGTDYEYFNAVWVRNEWSRFLSMMEKGDKKTLIPCYKDIDAYDMPAEFRRLQAQDMGKVGAMQDLLRGIEKILPREIPVTTGSAPLTEKEKRLNGPDLIDNIKLKGTNNPKDGFPKTEPKTTFDRSEFSYIYMRFGFKEEFNTDTMDYGFSIYDSLGNRVYTHSNSFTVKPDSKSFTRSWKIRKDNGEYLYDVGQYRIEAWAFNSRVFEYNFNIIDSSQNGSQPKQDNVNEDDKHRNGPSMISAVRMIGTNDPNDLWPEGTPKANIDRSEYSCIAVQVDLQKAANTTTLPYGITVFDSLGNKVFTYNNVLSINPECSGLSKVWVLKDDGKYLYDVGQYRLEAWVFDSRVFEYNFAISDSSLNLQPAPTYEMQLQQNNPDNQKSRKMIERDKRRNGPELINTVLLVGTNREDDYFPRGSVTNRIDVAQFSYLAMEIILINPIGYNGTAKYGYSIYDSYGNLILDAPREIEVYSHYDKFSLIWILRGKDGSTVGPGKYTLDAWVDDSRVFTCKFSVYDSAAPKKPETVEELLAKKQKCLQELSECKGIFQAKNRKRLEQEIAEIDDKIAGLNK